MLTFLSELYGVERAPALEQRLRTTLAAFKQAHPQLAVAASPAERLSHDDVILITYGDQVHTTGEAPLRTLAHALHQQFGAVVSGVHILPFFPYTSDDGFSVVDFHTVDPALGTWEDLAPLRERYRLMYDAVVNHISASSDWFQAFLAGKPGAERRFIAMDPTTDLSAVTRPRTTPLLTPFETPHGTRHIWTTFSADQIDINYADPDTLLAMIDVLLLYVAQGASLIRLDAIGYLWKEVGTRCIHLPQTHRVVQLWRSILDEVAPGVLLVTETNVPHADNISYFGDGHNEAQMVYQFPLAPLTLNAFHSGSTRHLNSWAATLAPPSPATTFFNFLASHDGIGVVPASGILSQAEVADLCETTIRHGGQVSYKNNSDGSQSPYELNITLFDALSDPAQNDPLAIDRFIGAHAIMLMLQGVPGIYIHSLIGSHNNHAGLAETGRARTINREKWEYGELARRMADPQRHERRVFERMAALIRARRAEPAFHPNAAQRVIRAGDAIFCLLRTRGNRHVLAIQNVSATPQRFEIAATDRPIGALIDLISGTQFDATISEFSLAPYQTLWLASA
ncbi:MAG TPA: sugar phosphorylase [Roseiflexaceae bacterium]|nr:sugar phosphorylase [Roseiflexaceae bacterium]HMP42656.1 sugar phosphorylase [Roseiflexaceae bacterium]